MKKLALGLLLTAACAQAMADGGRLQMHTRAGAFIVTLFTMPDPLRPGRADFSVAIEKQGVEGLDEKAHVTIILAPADGKGAPIALRARHSDATSRFLQAAIFSIPHSGMWIVTTVIEEGEEIGGASCQINILPGSLISEELVWQIVAVPITALFFCCHQRRKALFGKRLKAYAQRDKRAIPLSVHRPIPGCSRE